MAAKRWIVYSDRMVEFASESYAEAREFWMRHDYWRIGREA